MAEVYSKCEMIVMEFEKWQSRMTKLRSVMDQTLGKIGALQGLILDLRPIMPPIKQIDFSLYDEIMAACPFISPWLKFEDARARLNAMFSSFRAGVQSIIDDAFDRATGGLLDKVGELYTNMLRVSGYIRPTLNSYISILDAIVQCLEKLCDASIYKDQVQGWKDWAVSSENNESVIKSQTTGYQKQYYAKQAAWESFATY